MPEGAGTVFMQEDVRVDDAGKVCSAGGLEARRQCASPWGEDIPEGAAALFRKACGCAPQDIALLAAFGLTQVDVRRRIRVAVFSTGDELVSPGKPAQPRRNYSIPTASC